jgi:two-component system chemotaxis response regulator CheY
MKERATKESLRLPNIREVPQERHFGTGSFRLSRILLLDDENEVVDLCAKFLQRHHLVVKTSSPFEAVSFMDAGRYMIDLVICDYFMPGMTGGEFVDQIRALGIMTPIILCTGRVADGKKEEFGKFVRVLEKPFGSENLLSAVSEALAARGADGSVRHRLHAILPHLNSSLAELEKFLVEQGLEHSLSALPEKALETLGPGQTYQVFLSWYHLKNLRARIAA